MRRAAPLFSSRLPGQIGLVVAADRVSSGLFEAIRVGLVGDPGVGFGHWLPREGPKGPGGARGPGPAAGRGATKCNCHEA